MKHLVGKASRALDLPSLPPGPYPAERGILKSLPLHTLNVQTDATCDVEATWTSGMERFVPSLIPPGRQSRAGTGAGGAEQLSLRGHCACAQLLC
ncbi:unnamed protein product [Lampetra planeri]